MDMVAHETISEHAKIVRLHAVEQSEKFDVVEVVDKKLESVDSAYHYMVESGCRKLSRLSWHLLFLRLRLEIYQLLNERRSVAASELVGVDVVSDRKSLDKLELLLCRFFLVPKLALFGIP